MAQQPQSVPVKLIKAAGVIVAGAVGTFLSRWHGGGFISGSPKLLKAFLWSAPFSLATWLAFFTHRRAVTDWLQDTFERLSYIDYELFDLWVSIGAALIVLIACMVFKNTGHGGGMDVGHSDKEPGAGRDPEKLEYLILWLHGRIPRYWYDVLLLAVIGTFSVLFPAIAFTTLSIPAGLILLAGGTIGKPLGYMIGWGINDDFRSVFDIAPDDFDEPTEIGESLTGLFAYTCLALATILVVCL